VPVTSAGELQRRLDGVGAARARELHPVVQLPGLQDELVERGQELALGDRVHVQRVDDPVAPPAGGRTSIAALGAPAVISPHVPSAMPTAGALAGGGASRCHEAAADHKALSRKVVLHGGGHAAPVERGGQPRA
jgi:hypothetical protein